MMGMGPFSSVLAVEAQELNTAGFLPRMVHKHNREIFLELLALSHKTMERMAIVYGL